MTRSAATAQTFQNVTEVSGTENVGLYGTNLAWGDYDTDGDLDLYLADFFRQDNLYQNQGDVTFIEVGAAQKIVNLIKLGGVTTVAWGDYNGDGYLDIYIGKYYYYNNLYQNRSDGTLLKAT